MAYRNSSHTGRASRSLNEAFGPYTSRDFQERETGYAGWWWYSMAVIAVLTVVIIVVTR